MFIFFIEYFSIFFAIDLNKSEYVYLFEHGRGILFYSPRSNQNYGMSVFEMRKNNESFESHKPYGDAHKIEHKINIKSFDR